MANEAAENAITTPTGLMGHDASDLGTVTPASAKTLLSLPTDTVASLAALSPSNAVTAARTFTLADNAATSFTVPVPTGDILTLAVADGASINGQFALDAGASSACSVILATAEFAATTGVLAGTTGTDGKITVSCHTNGLVYIENRSGGSLTFLATFDGEAVDFMDMGVPPIIAANANYRNPAPYQVGGSGHTTVVAATVIREAVIPFYWPWGDVIDRIQTRVMTQQATASGVAAIYENQVGAYRPGVRLARASGIDCTSANTSRFSTISSIQLSKRKIYWLGFACSVTGVIITRALNGGWLMPVNASGDTGTYLYRDVETDIANTFADPFPSTTLSILTTGNGPGLSFGRSV